MEDRRSRNLGSAVLFLGQMPREPGWIGRSRRRICTPLTRIPQCRYLPRCGIPTLNPRFRGSTLASNPAPAYRAGCPGRPAVCLLPDKILAFSELDLHPTLLRGVEALGFARPTPIQSRAIPVALQGKDLLACAVTGSG